MMAAALAACEKEEETVTEDDKIACEDFKVEEHQHSCNSFTFESNVDEVHWMVNGQSLESNNGIVDFDADSAGTYIVEAFYENEDCPQGAATDFEIVVGEDCFEEDSLDIIEDMDELDELDDLDENDLNDLDEDLDELDELDDMDENDDLDEDEINDEIDEIEDLIEIIIDDVNDDMDENDMDDIDDDLDQIENDIDVIIDEVEDDIDVIIDEEEEINSGCDGFGVETHKHSCNSYTFTSNTGNVYWTERSEYLVNGNSQSAIDFDPQTPGTYVVEAWFEDETCPQGVSKEIVVEVPETCFE